LEDASFLKAPALYGGEVLQEEGAEKEVSLSLTHPADLGLIASLPRLPCKRTGRELCSAL